MDNIFTDGTMNGYAAARNLKVKPYALRDALMARVGRVFVGGGWLSLPSPSSQIWIHLTLTQTCTILMEI